jgi:hypothetical protein
MGGAAVTRRLLICAVLACVGAAIATPAAEAVKTPICGAKDADGNAILGSLALNDNSSTIKSYGTGKGDRRLALLFDVTGCTLPAGTKIAPGQVTLLPAKTGDDLAGQPNVAVSVEAPDPTGVAATIGLKLDEIDPGTHAGIVRIHVPQYLHDSFTPISESRTGWWVWPLLLGLAGALAGLVWGVGLHFADTIAVKFSWRQGVLLGVLALGAGLAAGYGYWHNQEVWTLGENGWPTVVSGFTASTAGALAGVTAALFKPKEAVDTKTADDKAAAGKKAIGEPA